MKKRGLIRQMVAHTIAPHLKTAPNEQINERDLPHLEKALELELRELHPGRAIIYGLRPETVSNYLSKAIPRSRPSH